MRRRLYACFWSGLVIAMVTGLGWKYALPKPYPTRIAPASHMGISQQSRGRALGEVAMSAVPAPVKPLTDEAILDRLVRGIQRIPTGADTSEWDDLWSDIEGFLTEQNIADLLCALPPKMLRTPTAIQMLEQWSSHDPTSALVWLAHDPQRSSGQINIAVGEWVNRDVEGIRAYLEQLPGGDWKETVLKAAAIRAVSSNRPAAAVDWLMQLGSGNVDPQMLDWAVADWSRNDFLAARGWAEAQTNPALRERALINIATGHASLNPVEAAEFALDHLAPGAALNQAAEGIVAAWAGRDPLKAAEWVAQFPEGEARRSARQMLIATWTKNDPQGAKRWILSQPRGTERDESLQIVALREAQSDPATALDLITHLSARQVQADTGAGILRAWARDDYEKARTWVQLLPSGPRQQQALNELENARTEPAYLHY